MIVAKRLFYCEIKKGLRIPLLIEFLQWCKLIYVAREGSYMKINKLIPWYGLRTLLLVLGLNFITYFGTRTITSGMEHHILSSRLDNMIPLCTPFIMFYFIAYVQWIIGFLIIARQDKNTCYRFLYGEMIAKGICLLCYIIYPTTIIRPEVFGDGIFDRMTSWLYMMDAPDNLFPSIHCLESYVCLRTAFSIKGLPKGYHIWNIIMTLGVFASTVLLKQHVIADILGAVATVEIGFWVTRGIFLRKGN